MRVIIIGAGNLGFTIAGKYLIAGHSVTMMTTHYHGVVNYKLDDLGSINEVRLVMSDDDNIFTNADLIILCVPGFLYEKWLRRIKSSYSSAVICSVVGYNGFLQSCDKVGIVNNLLVFQRVPYICRKEEVNGNIICHITGHKSDLSIYNRFDEKPGYNRALVANLIKLIEPIREGAELNFMSNPYSVMLSNSNPLLHTSRLLDIGENYYGVIPKFYEEWDHISSLIYNEMDKELHELMKVLNVSDDDIPTVLDHYGVNDIFELTDKISSIKSLSNINSPMVMTERGYFLDVNSRYFQEDFVIGLQYMVDLCKENNVDCKFMDSVLQWGLYMINKYAGK